MPAEITGARGHTVRVETSILVERNEVRSVRGTEDMTTVTTVVSTQEQTKGGAAGGRVAVGRSRVRLEVVVSIIMFRYHAIRTSFSNPTTSSDVYIYRVPTRRNTHFPVVSGGQTSNRTQVFILHPLILGQLADNTVAAGGAIHGGATTDRLMNLGVAVA